MSDQPFYAVYNCGHHVFAPWKVVWREQAAFLTSVVIGPQDDKPIVPDHKLMLVPCSSPEESHFVCAVLSGCVAAYIVASYAVQTSTTTHVLNYVPVPKFDRKNALHIQLANASKQAHAAAGREDRAAVKECEAQIDDLAAELWGLSKAESKDIQDSLEDLKS